MAAKRSFDRVIFSLVVFLSAGGLLMVYSASAVISQKQFGHPYHFLQHQLIALLVGMVCMVGIMRMDYRWLSKPWVARIPYLAALVLLVMALASSPVNGTHRWVRLMGFSFQPSELMKIGLLLFVADLLARRRDELQELKGPVLGCLIATGVAVALVALQPDLGTALAIAMVGIFVLFGAGLKWRFILIPLLVMGIAGGAMILTNDYQMKRIVTFLNPSGDPEGAGYQVRQSVLAVASGGVVGQGLGEGGQKLFFLPYPHTDFIFSNIGEELGLLGTMTVVIAFLVLMARGLRAASRAPNFHLSLVAYGVTVLLAGQAFINMGVCLEMLPAKGLPLPFISYGGSSLLMSCVASGLLLNTSQYGS